MTAADQNGALLRAAMWPFSTGVTVLLTRAETAVHGMTANAVCSIALDPPLVMLSLHNRSRMRQYLRPGVRFSSQDRRS